MTTWIKRQRGKHRERENKVGQEKKKDSFMNT